VLRAAEFGEITEISTITPFKVTFGNNGKPVCDFLLLVNIIIYLALFPSYRVLLLLSNFRCP